MTLLRFAALALAATSLVATPLAAQTTAALDGRLGKVEKELRAVQRVVFPQGVPLQPELAAPTTPTTAAGNAASAPISDLTTRVNAVERQLATLTGATEQNGNRVMKLEEALARVQSRLTAIENPTPSAAATEASVASAGDTRPVVTPVSTAKPATSKPATSKPTAPAATTKPSPTAVAKPDPERKSAVAAVEMPSTGDAIEDDYTYGFRLYTAKFYPEAQTKLKEFTAKHPVTQRRWSYAQNLLGRAYLDENKPALASVAFYDNYQKAPRGERAAESLSYLGGALIRLKKPTDACKVFAELEEVYGTKLSSEQRARATKGRADAKCAA